MNDDPAGRPRSHFHRFGPSYTKSDPRAGDAAGITRNGTRRTFAISLNAIAISLNAISKHILALERAGLVRRRRAWREHLVSFNPGPLVDASEWIEKRRTFWTARLDALDALLKAEDGAAAKKSRKKGSSR